MNRSPKHIGFLDHLRGIAILAVLLGHTIGPISANNLIPWSGWIRDFPDVSFSALFLFPFSFGQVGVAIFFVISGFCIHMSFHQQGQRWGPFFIRRFFRIYPAYFAALILFIFLYGVRPSRLVFLTHWRDWDMLFHQVFLAPDFLTHFFLVHNFLPSAFKSINGAFWSLAIEAQLYLLYPALLALVGKFGWRRVMFALAGCEILIQGVEGLMQAADTTQTLGGRVSYFLSCSALGYWFSWSLGAMIADAFLKDRPLPFSGHSPVWWLGLAVSCYLVRPLYVFWFELFALATAVCISRLLGGARPALKVPPFTLHLLGKSGRWSYSLYLLHMPLIFIYYSVVTWIFPDQWTYAAVAPLAFLSVALTWLAIIPLAVLWYHLFELPGIALGKRIIQKMDGRSGPKVKKKPSPGNGNRLALAGKYWLMTTAMLALVLGALASGATFTPVSPAENNNFAWALATNSDAASRNGPLAVKLAEDACQRTQYRVTTMVGTLAAAYAEAGRFKDAIATAQKACAQAAQAGNRDQLQENRKLLALYLKNQPYHRTPGEKP